MAMQMGSGSSGGRRGRRALNAEINVTPFVDVMLVLLIVFMITAPLLTTGVEVTLPRASADALPAKPEPPLEITLQANGKLYIQETEIGRDNLVAKLNAITGEGFDSPIYFRADEGVAYGDAVDVFTSITRAGYANLALVTDPRQREGR